MTIVSMHQLLAKRRLATMKIASRVRKLRRAVEEQSALEQQIVAHGGRIASPDVNEVLQRHLAEAGLQIGGHGSGGWSN